MKTRVMRGVSPLRDTPFYVVEVFHDRLGDWVPLAGTIGEVSDAHRIAANMATATFDVIVELSEPREKP